MMVLDNFAFSLPLCRRFRSAAVGRYVAFGRRGLAMRLLGFCRGLVLLSAPLAVRGQLAATTRARTPDPVSLIIRGAAAGLRHCLNGSWAHCRP
jgi:hypothetical protein